MNQHIKIDQSADKVTIATDITWHYATEPVTGRIIAVCPALNMTLELDADAAKSGTEVLNAITKSMDTYFGSMMKRGVLEAFLKGRGWVTPKQKFTKRTTVLTPRLSVAPTSIDDLAPAAC